MRTERRGDAMTGWRCLLGGALMTFCWVAGCTASNRAQRPGLEHYNLIGDQLALQGYSPVSYVDANRAEKGSGEYAVIYRGVMYYLKSAEQMNAFVDDPDRYEPAYGGWCAYGMAQGETFPVDPTEFEVFDGRLMLFLKNRQADAHKLWQQAGPYRMVERADRHWQALIENRP